LSDPVPPLPPQRDRRQTNSLILRLSLIGFITALASRATDPVIPQIAHDINVDPNAVALLSTAFALPFALVQPVLGPVGDMVGKVRVMIACLAVTILAMLASGLATNFSILLGARIVAGIAAGGIFPVGIAVIGDLVPVKERQVAIGRWLTAVITGNLLGSSLAGVIGDLTGWRGVFFVITALGVLAIAVAIVTLRKAARAKPAQLSLAGFNRGYGSVFANPRAKVCFGAVFVEGIVIFGLFPFVALLLHAAGETRANHRGRGDRGLFARRRRLCADRADAGRALATGSIDDRRRRARGARARACVVQSALAGAIRRFLTLLGFGFIRCTPRSRCRRPSFQARRAAPRCRCTRSSSSSGTRAVRWSTGLVSSSSARR